MSGEISNLQVGQNITFGGRGTSAVVLGEAPFAVRAEVSANYAVKNAENGGYALLSLSINGMELGRAEKRSAGQFNVPKISKSVQIGPRGAASFAIAFTNDKATDDYFDLEVRVHRD